MKNGLTKLSCLPGLRLIEIVLPNKLSRVGGGGWVAGVAGSSGNKAKLSQPAKLELGLGLSLAKSHLEIIYCSVSHK